MPDAGRTPVGLGGLITVEGRELRLAPGTGRGIRAEEDQLLVPGDPATVIASPVVQQAYLGVAPTEEAA